MMNVNLLGIDIAKNVFQLHGVDISGNTILKTRLSRDKLSNFIANLPECKIAMESCGGSNYWARVFQKSGHSVIKIRNIDFYMDICTLVCFTCQPFFKNVLTLNKRPFFRCLKIRFYDN